MRIVLSADMEGVSQLRDAREILACCEEYWERGKPRLEADVAAACEGLLAAGATEVVVLDNHASGNTHNIWADSLPTGARLEEWTVFELPEHEIDGFLQVGYHARGGVDGFLSHTYVPGLRLRVGEELISESHGRAWAAEAPLLGVVGNDSHRETLGSLEAVPFLVVQESVGRSAMRPVFADAEEGLAAIRAFSARCLEDAAAAPRPVPPDDLTLEASMPNGGDVAAQMEAGGWARTGQNEFAVELESWPQAQEPLGTAMGAAMAPFLPNWIAGIGTREEAAAADPEKAARLTESVVAWAAEEQPQWYSAPPPPSG